MAELESIVAAATGQGADPALIEALRRGWAHASAIIEAHEGAPVDLILKDLEARVLRLQEQCAATLTGRGRSVDTWFTSGFNQRVDTWDAQVNEQS